MATSVAIITELTVVTMLKLQMHVLHVWDTWFTIGLVLASFMLCVLQSLLMIIFTENFLKMRYILELHITGVNSILQSMQGSIITIRKISLK